MRLKCSFQLENGMILEDFEISYTSPGSLNGTHTSHFQGNEVIYNVSEMLSI